MLDLDRLDFTKSGGLVTVVAQDARTGAVLMVAHADREAMERTIATGQMHYRSRTRGLWHKGGTSGNVQHVQSLDVDCDGDAVLARVVPAGPACHTGAISCFGARALGADSLAALDSVIAARAAELSVGASGFTPKTESTSPATGSAPSYTRRLLGDRNLRLKKLGEESAELVTACADGDKERATDEAADLVYHALVALRSVGGSLADLQQVLSARAGLPPR